MNRELIFRVLPYKIFVEKRNSKLRPKDSTYKNIGANRATIS